MHIWGALQTHHIVKLPSPSLLTPISGVVLQWRNRLARRTYKQYLPSKRCGGCEFEPHLEHVFSWRNIKMYTHAGYVRQYSDQLTWGIEPTPSIHVYLSEMYVYPATIEPTPTWFVSLMWMLHVHCNIILHRCGITVKITCPGWGSNSRPSDFSLVNLDYETDALPTALPRPLEARELHFRFI